MLKLFVLMGKLFLPLSFLAKTFLVKTLLLEVNVWMSGTLGFLVMTSGLLARSRLGQVNIAAELQQSD